MNDQGWLLTSIISPTCIAILLFFLGVLIEKQRVRSVRRARRKQKEYRRSGASERIYEDWYRAARDVKAWKRSHCLGAIAEADKQVLHDLLNCELSKYHLYMMNTGRNPNDAYAENLKDQLSDWRS